MPNLRSVVSLLFLATFIVSIDIQAEAADRGGRTFANATVVSTDPLQLKLTIRGAGGRNEVVAVDASLLTALQRLVPGQVVILGMRGPSVARVVTHIQPSGLGLTRSGRAVRSARRSLPPPPRASVFTPPAQVFLAPARPRTDSVGPTVDPRVGAMHDPRRNPQRDPRIIPGLSVPAPPPLWVPLPAPTPSPQP